jgi:site-specific DNA recombinase
MKKTKTSNLQPTRKRMALYARVSTEEQTKGQYPSCESQVEELEAACRAKGWEIQEIIKDEGVSAGTLRRDGLSKLRFLVQSGQIDGVMCTWYDRLVRSRDFYVLDNEFNQNNVTFVTLHDPTDRHTASGRFLETMLVAAKTYEREQTAEKVRTKMRMRAEKGMWNGGYVPFGFKCDAQTQLLLPNKKQHSTVQKMFQVYADTQSDFKVRDWLRSHNVSAPNGKAEWTPSSIRDVLMNRRYVAEIEINKANKGVEGLPEFETYRILPAPHEPLVNRELFDLAQVIRAKRAKENTHRGGKGKGHSYSLNQCQRVYLLQSNMVCGICGAAMSPHYVYHKPNERDQRKTASYVYYYTCAHKMKYRQAINHSNRILARKAEAWMLDNIGSLATSDTIIKSALEIGWTKSEADLRPFKQSLADCQRALQENQRKIEELLETASHARGALLELFNEKAHDLQLQREQLKIESRTLNDSLMPLNQNFDADKFRQVLCDFNLIREKAEPQELQRLIRLIVRRLEWMPDNTHRVQYYLLDNKRNREKIDKNSGPSTGSRLECCGPPK